MATRWFDYAVGEIQEAFPEVNAGHWNCRHIGSGSTWSQHAWGNAGDLYHRDWGYSTNPTHQAYLDNVAQWIRTYFGELSIRTFIWRKKDHFNHVHIDGWPKGYGTPPCAGGSLRMKYNSGKVVTSDPGPVNGTIELPDRELITVSEAQVLEKGDNGISVAKLQAQLIELDFDLGNWDPFMPGYPAGADGSYGGATVTAVENFQTSEALIVTGKADGVTLYFIREQIGFPSGGELVKHTHNVKIAVPGQTVNAITGVSEA